MKQDILLTRFAAASSTIALALGFASVFTSIELGSDNASIVKVMLVAIFSISLLSLFYGNIVYQLTRIGQLKRHWNHRDDYSNIEALHRLDGSPTVSILVPSYKEQIPVVMQTIMSAALSEYPNRKITLLLDDPPLCGGADLLTLSVTRELVAELNETLAVAADRFRVAACDYFERASLGTVVISRERQIIGNSLR